MSRRSGLGRGLAALIPPSPPEEAPDAETGQPSDIRDGQAPTEVIPDGPAADAGLGRSPQAAVTDDAAERADERERRKNIEKEGNIAEPTRAPAVVDASAATLAEVDPSEVVPNPRQPREVFDPEDLAGLATSLRDVGVLQPLVVRPLEDGRYELVAGERRLRAALLAGLETIPVVIRHTADANLLKEALVENIHRVQLNPLEEAAAYQQLLEDFEVTQDELASRLGRSRPSISNAIRLLQLPPAVQRRVASGVLSAGHAKVLLAIGDPEQQSRLAERIVAEGMSVRATEELVRLRLLDGPTASPRARHATAPGLVELQDDLADALEARVRISMGARKGKLSIEFTSVEDLERIVGVIANGLEGRDVPGPARDETDAASPDAARDEDRPSD